MSLIVIYVRDTLFRRTQKTQFISVTPLQYQINYSEKKFPIKVDRYVDRSILEIFGKKYIFRYVFAGVLGPVLLIIIFVIVINVLQAYKLNWLPKGLQTWLWLPRPLRSLGWYDEHLFSKKCLCCKKKQVSTTIEDHDVHQNQVFNDQDQEFVQINFNIFSLYLFLK